MMLIVFVISKKPLLYGCTSVLLTAAGSTGVAAFGLPTQLAPARYCHAPGTMIWLSGTRATYMSLEKQNAHVRSCDAYVYT